MTKQTPRVAWLQLAACRVLLGETITASLAIGTTLIIAGITVVILDKSRD